MKLRRSLLCGLAATFLLSAAPLALAEAQPYPGKLIRFVVPYPPGGPLDAIARMLAEKMREGLGQQVIVDNRPGAGGNLGADMVAKAAPDGYTIVMGAVATHAINPTLFARMPYDPVRDFAPVSLVASVPNVLVINPGIASRDGIATLADLVRTPGRTRASSISPPAATAAPATWQGSSSSRWPKSAWCIYRMPAPPRPSWACWRARPT
jgi:tripartite-type tricarboxylate transporter receptor subunit TctC